MYQPQSQFAKKNPCFCINDFLNIPQIYFSQCIRRFCCYIIFHMAYESWIILDLFWRCDSNENNWTPMTRKRMWYDMILNTYDDTYATRTHIIHKQWHTGSGEGNANGVRTSEKMCAVFCKIRISDSLKKKIRFILVYLWYRMRSQRYKIPYKMWK